MELPYAYAKHYLGYKANACTANFVANVWRLTCRITERQVL